MVVDTENGEGDSTYPVEERQEEDTQPPNSVFPCTLWKRGRKRTRSHSDSQRGAGDSQRGRGDSQRGGGVRV